MGLYAFVWGYVYLSFNNNTHLIYDIRSDIYVFLCMGFGLGGCIWWVGLCFLQWWLAKWWRFGSLAFSCEIVDESNFYCVFGASGGFTFGV